MRQIAEQHLEHQSIWNGMTQKPLEWLAILIGLFLAIPPIMYLLFVIFFLYHPLRMVTIFSGVCILLFLASFLAKKQSFKIDRVFLLFILLAIVGIFSGILGKDFSSSFKSVIGVCFYPFFYLMVINVVDTRKNLKWIIKVIVLAATLQATIGVIEFIFNIQLFTMPDVSTSIDEIKIGSITRVRPSGSWDPDYFASLMVGSIPIAMLMIRLEEERVALRAFYIISLTLLIMSLILAFSKGALISFGSIILFRLFKKRGRRLLLILFSILVGLAFGLIVIYFLNSLIITTWINMATGMIDNINPANINFSKPRSLSIAFRWVHWIEAFQIIFSNPLFGIGPGNSIVHMSENFHRMYVGHTHNIFLLIAAEYGLLALCLYLLIVLITLKNYLEVEKVARRNQDKEMMVIAIGLQTSLLAYLIVFQGQPIAFNLNLSFLYAISGAIKHNILLKEKEGEQSGSLAGSFTSDRNLSKV